MTALRQMRIGTATTLGDATTTRWPIVVGQTIGNLIAGGVESQPTQGNGPTLGQDLANVGGAVVGGVEAAGTAIWNGLKWVGGEIGQGVTWAEGEISTAATDVGNFFNPPPAASPSSPTINLNLGGTSGLYGGSLINIGTGTGGLTQNQVAAILFNESRGLSIPSNNPNNVSLVQAETQEGYTLVNRENSGLPVGNRPYTAWDQVASNVMSDIVNNPTGENAIEYNNALAATNNMTTFGGNVADITDGATAYNNRNNSSLAVNHNITFSPVELQYGPFNTPAGPKYIDIYGPAQAKTNPVAPTLPAKPNT